MSATVTERPLLFSAPMVRAILEGRKMQTRRIVKPVGKDEGFVCAEMMRGGLWPYRSFDGAHFDDGNGCEVPLSCPYGAVGDRLWVRETWLEDPPSDGTWADTQYFGCKDSKLSDIPERFRRPAHVIYRADYRHPPLKWRPSIFMPRWASRLTLEITDVRVQPLQEISSDDALSEGINRIHHGRGDYAYHYERTEPNPNNWVWPENAFQELWEFINGAGSWDSNPWVWALTFRVIARMEKHASGY